LPSCHPHRGAHAGCTDRPPCAYSQDVAVRDLMHGLCNQHTPHLAGA
jgi:hypothetical protein